MVPSDHRSGVRWAALAAFLAPFVAFAWTACPSFYWLDSSELAAASVELGVMHPPGHPLSVLVGHLFQLLPGGSLAFRANLASAAAGAAAACVLFFLVLQLLASLELGTTRVFLALAASWVWAFSESAWLQGVRAEVYALQALLGFGILHQVLAWHRGHEVALGRACFLFGLGLGNHHLLTLLLGVAGAIWLLAHPRRRDLLRALPWIFVGAAILLYIPIRALREPTVNWGAAGTLDRLYWLLSARPFQQTVVTTFLEPLERRFGDLAFALITQWTLPVTAAALGGVWFLFRRPSDRWMGALLVGALGTNLVAPILVGFDLANADSHGYVLLSLGVGACSMAFFVGVAITVLQRRRAGAAWLAVLPLVIGAWQLPRNLSSVDLSSAWGADLITRRLLDEVPRNGTLVTHDFRTVFNTWYLRVAEHARADVRHVHAGFMGFPGYATAQRRAMLTDGTAVVEYDDVITEARLGELGPTGLLLSRTGSLEEHRTRRESLLRAVAELPHDRETDRALLWWHYRSARYFCRTNQSEAAMEELDLAGRYSRSPKIEELRRNCGRKALEK